MSMSTRVVGIVPADEKQHAKDMDAWDACKNAGVVPPKEILDRLGVDDSSTPSSEGILIEDWSSSMRLAVSQWNDEFSQGIEVDLRKLPENIKILRFYNTW